MGQAPRELTPLVSAVHFFGAELRHWRTLRSLSQAAIGRLTHHSKELIGKVEKGERHPSLALVQRLDTVLNAEGALLRLWPHVEQERIAGRSIRESVVASVGNLGLGWAATPEATVGIVGELWRAELDRRSLLGSVAWVAAGFAVPTREWLQHHSDDAVRRVGRRVGQADVDALWSMCDSFAEADHRLGGGYARSTLVHYVNHVVLPLLDGGYQGGVGRDLMAATARLCDLCAFMSFDSGEQGLAQRYFVQALRLAQASGDRALGAHVLADMSMQAHYMGNALQALELASAGYRTGRDVGSPSTAARCAAMEGRAHALAGDHRASDQARALAETTLEHSAPTAEPAWIRFFTAEQLAAESLYMAEDLHRRAEVQRIAPRVLASTGGMQRRRVLTTTALAASYVSSNGAREGDIEQACHLLEETIPALSSLTSSRSLQRVNKLRKALAPHARMVCVRDVEEGIQSAVSPPRVRA